MGDAHGIIRENISCNQAEYNSQLMSMMMTWTSVSFGVKSPDVFSLQEICSKAHTDDLNAWLCG